MNELYNKFKEPPANAVKTIGAGRLKGMSDINPQWRIECLTEMFGLCGEGWYIKIISKELKEGSEGETVATVDIELYYKTQMGEWSMPIQATGGSMFIAKEKFGLHTSDEAFKMAYTDALSVACKMLGIGSSIYRGTFNTKYSATESVPEKTPAEKAKETREANQKAFEERFNKWYNYMKGNPKWSYDMDSRFNAVILEAGNKNYEKEKCEEMLKIFDSLEKDSLPDFGGSK